MGAGGHGCSLAVSEVRSGYDGEVPDAIGFRSTGHYDGSVVIECKTSRSDFLVDLKKNHRQDAWGEEFRDDGIPGMGKWRYFLAPKGLIKKEELPARWGLLEVTPKGTITVICGAAEAFFKNCLLEDIATVLEQWSWTRNFEREQWVLVKLFKRAGDIETATKRIKEANGRYNRLANEYEKVVSENQYLKARNNEILYGNLPDENENPTKATPRKRLNSPS